MATRAEKDRIRRDQLRARKDQLKADQEFTAPPVPEMETLIAKAVANNSKEKALTEKVEKAERDLRYVESTIRKLQDDLIAEKTLHLQTAFKLIKALETVDNLKNREGEY